MNRNDYKVLKKGDKELLLLLSGMMDDTEVVGELDQIQETLSGISRANPNANIDVWRHAARYAVQRRDNLRADLILLLLRLHNIEHAEHKIELPQKRRLDAYERARGTWASNDSIDSATEMEILFARIGVDLYAIKEMEEMKAEFTKLIAKDFESRGFKGWRSPVGTPTISDKPEGQEKVMPLDQPESSDQPQTFTQRQILSGPSTFDSPTPKASGAPQVDTPRGLK